MTPRAKWMYLKLRYLEIPRILLKAQYLKMRKVLGWSKELSDMAKLDKSYSA